jgi:hypothetical protein
MAVTDYTGICVCRFIDGSINTVRVRLGDGSEIEIDPAAYFSRGARSRRFTSCPIAANSQK